MTDQDIEILRSIVKEWKDSEWKAKAAQAECDAMLEILKSFVKEAVDFRRLPYSFTRNGVEFNTKNFPILFCDTVLMEKK